MAAAQLSLADFGAVVRNTTAALQLDGLNTTALLRRAKALAMRREFEVGAMLPMARRVHTWLNTDFRCLAAGCRGRSAGGGKPLRRRGMCRAQAAHEGTEGAGQAN